MIACTANPDSAWVTQQARNLVMQLGEQGRRFELLIHDRDTKFSRAFDDVFRTEGIEVIRTPVRAPNANAFAERWVRTVRSDCLDRILIFGRRHLERVLRVYTRHYNEHRPHRALQLTPPNGGDRVALDHPPDASTIRRHDLLGGLIHPPIDRSEHELADWELLTDALVGALGRHGVMNVDQLRRGIESMPPDECEPERAPRAGGRGKP